MHKRLQACAKPGGLSSSYRSCPTSTASFSESVCSEATARSRRFGGKRTYALNFPVWSDGLRRGLGNEFEIGGCLHHHPSEACMGFAANGPSGPFSVSGFRQAAPMARPPRTPRAAVKGIAPRVAIPVSGLSTDGHACARGCRRILHGLRASIGSAGCRWRPSVPPGTLECRARCRACRFFPTPRRKVSRLTGFAGFGILRVPRQLRHAKDRMTALQGPGHRQDAGPGH